jgi:ABC-type transporter Mla maintaining outer membrane lipid asymmetry ATPase subunit MlaF
MPEAVDQSKPPVPALEMIDVAVGSLRAPERVVLEGVNWTVAAGDYWAIGGLHASGKSDFMALVAGLTRPVQGTYRVFGETWRMGYEEQQIEQRLRVGLVFDGGQLWHHLTLAENIALPLCYHQDRSLPEVADQVQPLLELAGLSPFAHQTPGRIGRNRQQRVGLARALSLKPEVLLLDNPLSGLDPRDAFWWLDLLDELAAGHPLLDKRPLTLGVTGDDLRLWQNRAHQFAWLQDKRFMVLGSRAELRAHPEALVHDRVPGPRPTS